MVRLNPKAPPHTTSAYLRELYSAYYSDLVLAAMSNRTQGQVSIFSVDIVC
jgi:hypothetical protein